MDHSLRHLPTSIHIRMGKEGVRNARAVSDRTDIRKEIVVREMVEVGLHLFPRERELIKGQMGVLQHIIDAIQDLIAVGGVLVKDRQPHSVGLQLLFTGVLVVIQIFGHITALAGALLGLLGMMQIDMGNLMRHHEGEFGLVGDLRQHAGGDQDNAVVQGVGIDTRREQHIEVHLVLQLRMILHQLLRDIVQVVVHRSPIEDASLLEEADQHGIIALGRAGRVQGFGQRAREGAGALRHDKHGVLRLRTHVGPPAEQEAQKGRQSSHSLLK